MITARVCFDGGGTFADPLRMCPIAEAPRGKSELLWTSPDTDPDCISFQLINRNLNYCSVTMMRTHGPSGCRLACGCKLDIGSKACRSLKNEAEDCSGHPISDFKTYTPSSCFMTTTHKNPVFTEEIVLKGNAEPQQGPAMRWSRLTVPRRGEICASKAQQSEH